MKAAPTPTTSRTRCSRWLRLGPLMVALVAWASSSCSPSGFQDAALVNAVRILASSANPPYAAPGSLVKLDVLAYDGRPASPMAEPMKVTWFPPLCKNPRNDAYYACFGQLLANAGGGGAQDGGAAPGLSDGGAPGSGGLPIGVDLTSLLASSTHFEFTMPSDAISAHPMVKGMPLPYGLVILFNVACAGHLELVPLDPANIQAPPIGCFDAQHNRVPPTDYVIGFTRIYAYDPVKNPNNNPDIDYVDVDGMHLPLAMDGTLPSVTMSRCASRCTKVHIGPVVPDQSWEPNPEEVDVHGNPVHEQIWAEFFSTFGSFSDDVHLLFDAASGRVAGDTRVEFQPPGDPGSGLIWVIVHDNRGGAKWATLPVTVQ
jgi:hypothetical protein